jgi:CRISPR-associated endonuclease Cas1
VRRALAWAQYARLGQSTRFGQGAFRIEELGDDRYECRRSVELVDLCLRRLDIDGAAERYQLPAGTLRRAASELRKGSYQPKPVHRVPIVQPDGRERTLAIPTPIDRGLQHSVHAALLPAIDRLLEESAVAYRRGLGRATAVRRLRDAARQGFRFGLRADFRRFFDSIPHDVLRDRIEAYLGDATMTKLLMRWVAIGAPASGMGIPTGAPISPLLANLFLDQFDEEMQREGGFLVRYADDFVLLYRSKEEADAVFARATESARALELELNAKKTHHFGPDSTFDFVGYRFEHRDRWTAEPTGQPQPLDEIGWRHAPKPEAPFALTPLPGEGEGIVDDDRAIVVVGPRCTQVRLENDSLVFTRQAEETSSPLRETRELIIIGSPTLTGPAIDAMVHEGIRVVLTDDRGFMVASLTGHETIESPEAVAGQVACANDERWSLALGRLLIAAKIRNYRSLAVSLTDPTDESVLALRSLEDRAHGVESIESLLGIEGAAAARWYRLFGKLLPSWCRFERRVAPNAEDPGNVMLNIAMTALHRQVIAAVRAAGLIPTMGILHSPRAGHASLASDLQEPFRHLMDRAVIHVARRLKPDDFREAQHADSDYRLEIRPKATTQLTVAIHETFAVLCANETTGERQSYRTHLISQARSLKRHLIDRTKAFCPFRHPQ